MRTWLNAYLRSYVVASLICCWWLWYISFLSACAAAVRASVRISDGEMRVGQTVHLDIIVQGARNAEVPDDIRIEGLRVSYVGRSTQIRMLNTQVDSSSTYTFSVYPLRAGTFIIPALQVKVDGAILLTKPLSLKVVEAFTQRGRHKQKIPQQSPPSRSTDTKLAFGMLSIPKKEAYLGDIIPIKVQYFFHPNLSVQSISSAPSLIGEGFMVQEMSEPKRSYREINGTKYTVLAFQSSVCPIRAGKLQIPPASLICQVLERPLLDISQQEANVADAFLQRFFGTISVAHAVRKIEVRSDSATIQALSLPNERQPVSFHGAIGNFALRVEVSTKDSSLGDPITLRAIISGEGNFERIRELELDGRQGWKSYSFPPKFKRLGGYGEKVFEWMLVPSVEKNSTPEVVFSYFNPTLTKYITLRSASAVRARPASHSASAPEVRSSVPLTEKEKRRVVRKFAAESYQPITGRPEFAAANGIAILALLAFVGSQLVRNFKKSGELRSPLKASLDRLSDPNTSAEKFYSSAAEFLLLRAQLASGKNMRGESAQEVVRAIGLVGEESKLALKTLVFHEETSYGFCQVEKPPIETRAAILRLLGHLG
ncbi:MAG: BatD family protein [Candidatus Xiphinematobacter sp.]|nr:MAG: BatD family protein [Candidatus Xiphinematobacter sp.]